MTTFHARPEYQIHSAQAAPSGYPAMPAADAYSVTPFQPTYEARRAAYFQHLRANPAPTNTKALFYELARVQAGEAFHAGVLAAVCAFVEARNDCADFSLHGILRLLYQFSDHPAISAADKAQCRATVLGFKYWPHEPGRDSLCTWTENHHILYASAAYLFGQMFPEQIFTNSAQTGQDKMARNRPRILRWLDLRFRTGFSEWLSHVYYDEDLVALLALADFCADGEIQRKAVQLLDLMALDIALNSFQGVFGSTHGRSYENSKKWAAQEGTTDVEKLLFGMGQFSGFDSMAAPALALSGYRLPGVIEAIAQERALPEMVNRQRMGICIDQAEQWGLGFESFEDGMTYLTLEAYLHPRTIALTLRMFDAFGWWENRFFAPFKPYRGLLGVLRRLGMLPLLARALRRDVCRNTREAVNLITCRTPDYLLSTAQDYRKGYGGDQQHIWQATLGPNAVCFTTHPAQLSGAVTKDQTPNAWAGSGLLPRAAQIHNVVVVVYKIERIPAVYVPTRLFFSHAWLPKDQFDEVIEREQWIFARKHQGYLALRSQQPYRWQTQVGEDCQREIIAAGAENIWICEMGRAAVDGSFENFITRILGASLTFERLRVRYQSPSQGLIEFGWQGDLRQNGQPVELGNYPRYDNPYMQADFPAEQMTIRHAEQSLRLDWQTGLREAFTAVDTETPRPKAVDQGPQ